jgi:hypothetical protein
MSAKRTTAYFAFSAATREEAKAALQAAGAPAGVADVAKALGERWRGLSEEDKKVRRRGAARRGRGREGRGSTCVGAEVFGARAACVRACVRVVGADALGAARRRRRARAQVCADKAAAVNDAVRRGAARARRAFPPFSHAQKREPRVVNAPQRARASHSAR